MDVETIIQTISVVVAAVAVVVAVAARRLGKALGGKITAAYYTLGQYDMVVIMEAPSNEAALQGLFVTGSLGNVQTETLVAIPAEQGDEIIETLPFGLVLEK